MFKAGIRLYLLALLCGSAFAQSSIVCSDSDKGKNLEVKGALTLKFYQGSTLLREQSYTDFFSGSRNRYLEFYCNGSQPAYEIIACPNESLGNACPVIPSLAEEPKIQVSLGPTIRPKILTSGMRDEPILNFSLLAYDGEVDIEGLHFVIEDPGTESADKITRHEIQTADFYTYELYDRYDNLLAQTKGFAGRVYFDLSNSPYRLTGNEEFTVKVDVPSITEVEASWRWFRLVLDRSYDGNGIQATSVESGNFVEGVVLGQIGSWPSSELFINATTNLSLSHTLSQPEMVEPSLRGQEFYRFDVAADRSGTAQIEQVTLEVIMEGMEFYGEVEARVFKVNDDDTVNFTTLVTDETEVTVLGNEPNKGTIRIDFRNQLVLPNQVNTYAVFLNRTRANNTGNISYVFSLLTDNQKSTTRNAELLKSASNIVWSDFPGLDNEDRFMRGFLTRVEQTVMPFIDS